MFFKDKIREGHLRVRRLELLNFTGLRYVPRWVVFVIDLFIVFVSLYISGLVFRRLGIEPMATYPRYQRYLFILTVSAFYMLVFRTYSGIIRHSTFFDLSKILSSNLFTAVTLAIINILHLKIFKAKIFHNPVLPLFFSISFVGMFFLRLLVKETFLIGREIGGRHGKRKRILILGIGNPSVAVAKAITENATMQYEMAGFLTERKDSSNAKLLGKRIINRARFESQTKEQLGIDGIVLMKELLTNQELNDWVNLFLEKDLKVYYVPSVQKVRHSDGSIKELKIEDLLNRRPIKIENKDVKLIHKGARVLVTGGAGSIGSEIVRHVAQLKPEQIVILDQAETPLYNIGLEMKEKYPNIPVKLVISDVKNEKRLEDIFAEYNFSIVYHAAAYKHVPLSEEHPQEAILTNVLGSRNLALLASKYNVERFVMVSTDKAVNPTNVMGATKRVAEMYVQSLQGALGNQTKFITTRFGNVLGSNGSVIPIFRKQIKKGGPVTITHPDIVRYFMTIPEACELVLQAGTMGKGGEIYVFDMGEPVKIVNLAKRMIKLSGLQPDVDIKLVYTGLRPGEKLYEELLSDDTTTLPTEHHKIMISKDPCVEFEMISHQVEALISKSSENSDIESVRILKEIVKEFKSNNSVYESLD